MNWKVILVYLKKRIYANMLKMLNICFRNGSCFHKCQWINPVPPHSGTNRQNADKSYPVICDPGPIQVQGLNLVLLLLSGQQKPKYYLVVCICRRQVNQSINTCCVCSWSVSAGWGGSGETGAQETRIIFCWLGKCTKHHGGTGFVLLTLQQACYRPTAQHI